MVSGSMRWIGAVLATALSLMGCSGGEQTVDAEALEQAQAIEQTVVTTAAPPGGSSCERGGLVDAGFRDAALAALSRLVVHAPGLAAHGAIKLHHSPGLVDAQGRDWHFIQAYHVNLTMTEALRVAPELAPVAANWLRWQARHIRSTRWRQGVVFDHWVRAADLRVMECPPGGPARRCPDVDSHDSTAASLLLMADSYRAATGDLALLREPAVRAALEVSSTTLYALGKLDGLTWATPDFRVAYVMDAAEVAAGWHAWARLQELAYGDATSAGNSRAAALRTENAARQHLWHAASQSWRVAAGHGAPNVARWYPDTVAQAWPLLWGLQAPSSAATADAWRRAAAHWQGAHDWSRRIVDPGGFWWAATAVAARCVGDSEAARRWVARARADWMRAEQPFAWPFHLGELRWLFWMSDTRSASPAS